MAKAKMKVAVLRVVSSREGFRRAGFTFGRDPRDLTLADLKKEQIAMLKSDPTLACVETTVEVDAETEDTK